MSKVVKFEQIIRKFKKVQKVQEIIKFVQKFEKVLASNFVSRNLHLKTTQWRHHCVEFVADFPDFVKQSQIIKKRKIYFVIAASWLILYCHTANLCFPILIIKYLNLKNYSANFDENCKIYSKEMLVNDINGIIDFDTFNRIGPSSDNLYLGVTFLNNVVSQPAVSNANDVSIINMVVV